MTNAEILNKLEKLSSVLSWMAVRGINTWHLEKTSLGGRKNKSDHMIVHLLFRQLCHGKPNEEQIVLTKYGMQHLNNLWHELKKLGHRD